MRGEGGSPGCVGCRVTAFAEFRCNYGRYLICTTFLRYLFNRKRSETPAATTCQTCLRSALLEVAKVRRLVELRQGAGAGRGLVVMRRCDDRLPHVGLLEAAPGCSRPRSRSQSRSRGGGSSTSGRASPYPPEAHARWWGAKPVCSQNGVGPRCSGSATSTPVGRPSISCCTWLG